MSIILKTTGVRSKEHIRRSNPFGYFWPFISLLAFSLFGHSINAGRASGDNRDVGQNCMEEGFGISSEEGFLSGPRETWTSLRAFFKRPWSKLDSLLIGIGIAQSLMLNYHTNLFETGVTSDVTPVSNKFV